MRSAVSDFHRLVSLLIEPADDGYYHLILSRKEWRKLYEELEARGRYLDSQPPEKQPRRLGTRTLVVGRVAVHCLD